MKTFSLSLHQRALLGLWAIPGVGPATARRLLSQHSDLGSWLLLPSHEWLPALGVSGAATKRLARLPRLETVAQQVEERMERGRMHVTFPGQPRFPPNLVGVDGAPPLLFYRGRSAGHQPAVAMVGSRCPEGGFVSRARLFAAQVAHAGVTIVSGAAYGVNEACHWGAIDAGQPTWAFLGCALDAEALARHRLLQAIVGNGGILFSELPPGIVASRQTFPRRNRLISGASNAILVMRAAHSSGTLHTAKAARIQGRPLLAFRAKGPTAAGCRLLLDKGAAQPCRSPEDVWKALGIQDGPKAACQRRVIRLSQQAGAVLAQLGDEPVSFEHALDRTSLGSAALVCALSELEVRGLAVQHPGKWYQRV